MKPGYLLAVGFAAIMAIGAAVFYGVSRIEQSGSDAITAATDTTAATDITTGAVAQRSVNSELARHDAYLSFSDSAESFDDGALIATSASVPDVVVCSVQSDACNVGELLVYFVDTAGLGAAGSEGVAMIRSTDGGKTWSDRQSISLPNRVNKGPVVDPSIVQLAGGTLRLYFYGPDAPLSDVTDRSSLTSTIYSATSSDGVTFTLDAGTRLVRTGFMTDPEVLGTSNGWFMYYSLGQETGVASSVDGLTFVDHGSVDGDFGGVPGAVLLPDDSMRVYGCRRDGIMSSTSSSWIQSFSSAAIALSGMSFCDPSVQAYEDGFIMVYKAIRDE